MTTNECWCGASDCRGVETELDDWQLLEALEDDIYAKLRQVLLHYDEPTIFRVLVQLVDWMLANRVRDLPEFIEQLTCLEPEPLDPDDAEVDDGPGTSWTS